MTTANPFPGDGNLLPFPTEPTFKVALALRDFAKSEVQNAASSLDISEDAFLERFERYTPADLRTLADRLGEAAPDSEGLQMIASIARERAAILESMGINWTNGENA
jgi:hypothetical protein